MNMTILGISGSHEAHACIVRDGYLLAAAAEERFSRRKADEGYPRRAIEAVLVTAGVEPKEIDIVALDGLHPNPIPRMLKRAACFSVQDWIRQNHEYWKPKLIDRQPLTELDDFHRSKHVRGDDVTKDPFYPFIERTRGIDDPQERANIFDVLRKEIVTNHLGIPSERIQTYRHEDCHKAYGYYAAPFAGEDALIFTNEGGGDDSSATVSTVHNGVWEELWKTNGSQLGRLYGLMTLLLGMKPNQHEYKVMGLAPYGTEYHGRRALEFFRTINRVVGTEIHDIKTVRDLYFSARDALEGERFDGIAWGLQTFLEEVLTQWVANNVRIHGLRRVVLSGGVAQNIKACKRIAELPGVEHFWVGPVSGDGSLAIGAAWLASRAFVPDVPIRGIETIYLGTAYGADAIDAAIDRHSLARRFSTASHPTPQDVATWLDAGHVVARFSGRMEFGQRALGNRSILADPRRAESVERINEKIKYRDFWMPFTPSMLAEDVDRFIENPKNVHSPYMTMAFDTKPGVAREIPAVIHPADKTTRPQMLKRAANPSYYDIIRAFKERTGIGAVLNTSFNLHGDAIVESPDHAIETFLKSDLDILLFDHVAIGRVPLRTTQGAAHAAAASRVAA